MADTPDIVAMTAEIVSAYINKNSVQPEEIPALIERVHNTLARAAGNGAGFGREMPTRPPAVDPEKSVTDDLVICLECGAGFRSLRRHLRVAHGLEPAEYRQKWNLAHNHALTAPAYSARRSEIAKDIGLGLVGRDRE